MDNYRKLNKICCQTPGVVTVNTKYFPSPVEDPYLAARVHNPKWLHHVVTHPDQGKTHDTTTEGNIHPALDTTVQHQHNQNRVTPYPYSFVAHNQTAGGCRGC